MILSETDAVSAFFAEVYSEMTRVSPINCREVLFEDTVAITLSPDYQWDGITLVSIRSMDRGRGNASKALDWACALADKHGLRIHLQATPFGNTRPRLSYFQLRKWYKSRGFVPEGRSHMYRQPKEK